MKKEKSLYPKKIYVELTTRCNLHCQMCVKHMAGSSIAETEMDLTVLSQLLPSLAFTEELILNGIGEPLLYPNLLEVIRLARSRMPVGGRIGFQSNGVLLDKELSLDLIEAGLNSLCLSVNGFGESSSTDFISGGGEHSFSAVEQAVSSLKWARRKTAGNLEIGLEIVLTKDNINELSELIGWAADNGVDYIITTHLILYDKPTENLNLFNPNSKDAAQLFSKYNQLVISKGMDFGSCLSSYRKYAGTRSDSTTLQLIGDLKKEAREKDIRLNIAGLLENDNRRLDDLEHLYQKAQVVAEIRGVELFLPPLQANNQRSCRFMVDEATFISPNGDVMPCHFLWHTYSCRVLNEDIHVQKRVIGNILQHSLGDIWQSKEYMEFRKEAGQYDYSSCWSCSQGPCSNLVNDDNNYANDCYGSNVPCGHCQWNLGGIRCL